MKLAFRSGISTLGLILVILLICILFGGYGIGWGAYAMGPLGLILVVLIILILVGKI